MSDGRNYHVICNDLRVGLYDLTSAVKRHFDGRNNAIVMQVAHCEDLLTHLQMIAKASADKLAPPVLSKVQNAVNVIKKMAVGATFDPIEDECESRESLMVDIDYLIDVVSQIESEAGFRRTAQLHPLNDKEVRQKVWELTGGRCTYCDCQLENGGTVGASFVVEHVVPRSCGGPDNIANYVPACASCNNSKGDRHVLQFIQTKMDRRRPPLTVVPLPVAAAE